MVTQLSLEARAYDDEEFADLVAGLLLQLVDSTTWSSTWLTPAHVVTELNGRSLLRDRSQLEPWLRANGGKERLIARIDDLMWHWVRLGLVKPVAHQSGLSTFGFAPTQSGREVLENRLSDDAVLLTEEGAARRLRDRCPTIPEVVTEYLSEAQGCIAAGRFRAGIVMIGGASEALVLSLADQLERNRQRFELPRRPAPRTALGTLKWTTDAFEDHQKPIRDALREVDRPDVRVSEVAQKLRALEALRATRNEAGHPTPVRFDRESARIFLVGLVSHGQILHETTEALSLVHPS
jgi:hypothetical protein